MPFPPAVLVLFHALNASVQSGLNVVLLSK